MQKKLTKQFIYNWLKDSLYGEGVLHKTSNRSTKRELNSIWRFAQFNRKFRGRLSVRALFHPKYKQGIFRNIFQSTLLSNIPAFAAFTKKNNLLKEYVGSPLMLARSIVNYIRIADRDAGIRKVKSYVTYSRELLSAPAFVNFGKWSFDLRDRVACSLYTQYDLTSPALSVITSYNSQPGARFPQLRRQKNFSDATKNYIKPKLPSPAKPVAMMTTFQPNIKISSIVEFLYSNSWISLAYWLRQRLKRLRQVGPRKALGRPGKRRWGKPNLRFKFVGVFKKKKRLVNRNELSVLLTFRLLQYFGVINSDGWWYTKKKPLTTVNSLKGARRSLTFPTFYEFRVGNVLMRAGILENGYVVNSVSRRGLFLINRNPLFGNSASAIVRIWDIITVSQSIWWVVYARFINFFSRLLNFWYKCDASKNLVFAKSRFIPQQFIKRHLAYGRNSQFMKLLRGQRQLKKLFFGVVRNPQPPIRQNHERYRYLSLFRYSLKNRIFASYPSYMEVSYKLLLIVLFTLPTGSDITPPLSLRGLKRANFDNLMIPNTFSLKNNFNAVVGKV